MATANTQPETTEEESFIILGTSPGTSLDLKCDGIDGLDRVALDDAIKDLSGEASMAFKAHFKLNDGPSPASLMVASTIITDDKSTEELQKRFGEILDENVILKETLQKNNESMKEQFLLIASCQEDMMKTHLMHKEKFDETKDLVEKLRQENKKLKLDVARLAEGEASSHGVSNQSASSGTSALEFVTSPDDDTVDKLTAQLDLVEKQRRQVIVENEKLNWQKESLEHMVDATTKERDDLKEKVKKLELQLSTVETEYTQKINLLNETILDLQTKLDIEKNAMKTSQKEDELSARIEGISRMSSNKISALQGDLKQAQLKILELETVKLEFSKYKSGVAETVKMYKDQIQELQNKLKQAQTTVFQPLRFSLPSEAEGGEQTRLLNQVKLYDKTLKHLADLLNLLAHGSIDSLVSMLGVLASVQDMKLEAGGAERVRASLAELRELIDKQHTTALDHIGQVKGTLSIFEGIFKDYNELLKKDVTKHDTKPGSSVEQLTAALVARGRELQEMQLELTQLREQRDHSQLLTAQLDLYKSDFEAEREAREKMACEKDGILTDLRNAQRLNTELTKQLETIRKNYPNVFQKTPRPQSTGPSQGPAGGPQRPHSTGPQPGTRRQSTPGSTATGNMVYTCPKCLRFSSDQYKAMEDHFDFCLDDF